MAFKRIDGFRARRGMAAAGILAGLALTGCHPDMWNQPKFKPFARNDFFKNEMAMRLPVDGTFAYEGKRREWLHPIYQKMTGENTVPSQADTAFFTGKRDGQQLAENYFKVTPELLARGKERYEITCSPCHGYTGEGGGIVVQRGFPTAASYHIDRLRETNDGYIYDVITNGFGRMYSYAARVAPEDRWAIIAYIRALQQSQDVDVSVPDSEDAKMVFAGIEQQKKAEAEAAAAHHAEGGEGGHGGTGAEATSNEAGHEVNAQ